MSRRRSRGPADARYSGNAGRDARYVLRAAIGGSHTRMRRWAAHGEHAGLVRDEGIDYEQVPNRSGIVNRSARGSR